MQFRSAIVVLTCAALRSAFAADAVEGLSAGAGSQSLVTASRAEHETLLNVNGGAYAGELIEVHDHYAGYRQAADAEVWGRVDYWATPLEFEAQGSGDCEDFAIAKYFSLLRLGVPEDNLRLMLAQLWDARRMTIEMHMVLAYYATPDSVPLILDNIDPGIHALSQRHDLLPRLAFNRNGWWKMRGAHAVPQAGTVPLARWHDLLARTTATTIHP